MYVVNAELPADRNQRKKDNKGRTTNYGKRWKRILEKRAERLERAEITGRQRRSAKVQGS